MDTYPVTVVDVTQETPRDRSLLLALDAAGRSAAGFAPGTFKPGQAVALTDPNGDGKARYYSVSSRPNAEGRFEVTIRHPLDQPMPQYYDLPVGTVLQSSAPMGSFVLALEADEDLLLLAAGSGIAPFRAFGQQLLDLEPPQQVTLVHSVRTAEHLLFEATFRTWMSDRSWFRYVPTVTAAGTDELPTGTRRGRVDRALVASLVPRPEQTVVYACGPGPFVEHALDLAAGLGVQASRLRREQW